ncbi:Vesicle transport v-SNARE protein vti1 [Cytospora mali]|uniref:Vesicle transport v-SNARE protein vti1 n=1 Tax=Cytospora mali TaxID=578113 RepID=A0A194VSW2_CYTMA|nr:Vesicle transport v-SNARE protein vti1 [Valsa mali]
MSNPLDTDAGSELFESYSAEFRLVQADLQQKLDQIPELTGEPRKAAISQAERALEEAEELLGQMQLEKQNIPTRSRTKANQRYRDMQTTLGQMQLEKQNIPTRSRTKANQRYRDMQTTVDQSQRKLRALADDRSALFGARERYSDNPGDVQLEQRQQLLAGSDRLDRSTQRLKASQRLANETEAIGASTLADLHRQRETIQHTNETLLDSEGYVDRSVKTLRGMARWLQIGL